MMPIYLILLLSLIMCGAHASENQKSDPVLDQIKRAIKPVELTNSEDISIIYEVPKKDLNIKLSDLSDATQKLSQTDMKQEENVDEIIDKAFHASQSGSLETAIYLYKKVLKKEPDNMNAIFSIGSLYHKLGIYPEAKAMYKRVLDADPKHSKAINNYILLLTEDNPHKALKILKGLEKANPEYTTVLSQLGITYSNLGDYPNAQKYFIEAARHDIQNPTHLMNLAIMLEKSGDTENALKVYQDLEHQYTIYLSKQQKLQISDRINALEQFRKK